MRASLLFGICLAALAAAPAIAADLPLKAPPAPPPVPAFNWTGFYIGANIGGAFTHDTLTDNLTGASLSSNNDGFIGGGQVGYNWQINSWVLGVEWDIDGTTLSRTGPGVVTAIGTLQGHTSTDWISTLTGRIGYAADRWLWYAKGGGAWAQESASITNLGTGASVSASNTRSGWTVGGGVEWAFAQQWSAKLEYDFVRLDNSNFNTFVGDSLTFRRDINMVMAGVNYRFNWGGGY
jgi:outer membrane immunogenic protein